MRIGVVVTGTGTITPIGNDVESFWQGLKDKTVGTSPITYFDITEYKCKLAVGTKGFSPKQCMDAKAACHMEILSQFAVAASEEALEQFGTDMEKENPYRIGVCVGSGIGSLQAMKKDVKKPNDKGPSRVNPLLIPLIISNTVVGNVTIQLGLKGECFNVVTACVTRTRSIGEALCSIQHGKADVMVAGGAGANTTSIGIVGFTSLTALNATEDVPRASIPLDEDRNGSVMGEGASVVVLGSLEYAKARGANILAEVVGYGATCDAFHITPPAEDGSGAARAMENAMKDAGIATEDTDYISAHGTNTHHSDLFEAEAIKLVLGNHAQEVKANSIKSVIGHLLGVAGDVESIICVKFIQNGFVHVAAGLKKPGGDYNLDYTMGDGVSMDVDVTISNSLGFGGHNTSLTVKKFNG